MTAEQFFEWLLAGGLFLSVLGFGAEATVQDVIYLWRQPRLLAIAPALPTVPSSALKLGANPPYVHSMMVSTSLICVVTVPVSLAKCIAAQSAPTNT